MSRNVSVVAEGGIAVVGLLRLLRLDPSGLAYLRATPDGFIRSFWAAAVVTPALLFVELAGPESPVHALGLPVYLLIKLIQYAILWGAIPLMMWYVTDMIDRRNRFYVFATAYNWGQIVSLLIGLPYVLLAATGGIGPQMAVLLGTVTSIATYCALGLIYYFSLQVKPLAAIGLVLLDVFCSQLIVSLTDTMVSARD